MSAAVTAEDVRRAREESRRAAEAPPGEASDGPGPWYSPADALTKQAAPGPRLKTGFPTLDAFFRGGVPPGKLLSLVSKPGCGKTTLAIQLAGHFAAQGAACGLLMSDEGMGPAVLRLAQGAGCDRTRLEAGDPAEIEAARRALAGRRIHFLDPDDESATFEGFVEGFTCIAPPGVPQVWAFDSAQIVRLSRDEKTVTPREKVKALTERIRKEAVRRDAIALLVSQSNRSAYRQRKASENSDPIAAAAESNAIEYMSDVMLFLTGDTHSFVDLLLVKSRLGASGGTVRLLFDPARATFREADRDEPDPLDLEASAKHRAKIAKVKVKLLAILKKEPDGLPSASLVDRSGFRKADVVEARNELEEASEIFAEEDGESGKTVWKIARIPQAKDDAN